MAERGRPEATTVEDLARRHKEKMDELNAKLLEAAKPCQQRWRALTKFYTSLGSFRDFITSGVWTWNRSEHARCIMCGGVEQERQDAALLAAFDALAKAGGRLNRAHVRVVSRKWIDALFATCTASDGTAILHSAEFGVRSDRQGEETYDIVEDVYSDDADNEPAVGRAPDGFHPTADGSKYTYVRSFPISDGRAAVLALCFTRDPRAGGDFPEAWRWLIERLLTGFACAIVLRDLIAPRRPAR